jgi:hypothetical protein
VKRAIILLVFVVQYTSSNAQCAMCRAVLESELGQETARGVNNGIIYLMLIPYILIGGLAFFLYRYLKGSK